MFAEFNKTQKFADQTGTVGFSGSKTSNGVTRLPGPHYILENANYGVIEQEQRTRAADAATADRWFRSKNSQNQPSPGRPGEPSPYAPPEADFDSEYGPPGVPLLLAVARNSVGMDQPELQPGQESMPPQNMYDLEKNGALLMHEKTWLTGGMATPDSNQSFMSADQGSLPMLQMNAGNVEGIMFPPPAPPSSGHLGQGQVVVGGGQLGTTQVPHEQVAQGQMSHGQPNAPHQQYLQPQSGMYMNGYGAQYTPSTGPEQAAYMQQQFG